MRRVLIHEFVVLVVVERVVPQGLHELRVAGIVASADGVGIADAQHFDLLCADGDVLQVAVVRIPSHIHHHVSVCHGIAVHHEALGHLAVVHVRRGVLRGARPVDNSALAKVDVR